MPPFTPWSPLPLFEVGRLLGGGFRWWVAGGYAIELAVGRVVRPHGDVDVLLLRRDQLAAQQALDGWELWAADPPGRLRPWVQGEVLGSDVHDIWCRPGPGAPWRLQLMLDESSESGAEWMSRRDSSVRRAVASLGAVSPDGLPYLRPEVQLYYKAGDPRPKDELDFAAALAVLDGVQRGWLAEAITRTYGEHPWHARLRP
ncbi:MAG TPA: amino acid transporter [Streptomyces sp.]